MDLKISIISGYLMAITGNDDGAEKSSNVADCWPIKMKANKMLETKPIKNL